MINETLKFLKTQINDYLKVKTGLNNNKLNYLDTNKIDPVTFEQDQITLVLLHIEEERKTKKYPPPPRLPDVHLYLYLLFICRFQDYEEGAKFLSLVIQFFQSNPFFDRQSFPTLGQGLDLLVPDMVAMPLIPKNEIWDLLKTSYLPSVLYKVRQVNFVQTSSTKVPTVKKLLAEPKKI